MKTLIFALLIDQPSYCENSTAPFIKGLFESHYIWSYRPSYAVTTSLVQVQVVLNIFDNLLRIHCSCYQLFPFSSKSVISLAVGTLI